MAFELGLLNETGAIIGGDQAAAVDYLPYGVKTLKVAVSGKHKGKLQLRPLRLSPNFGEKFGHEDQSDPPGFVVSWGGGHEDYCELNYPKKRVAYFLVHHVGQSAGDATLTIVATDPKSGETAVLPVDLNFPTRGGPWDPADLVQARWHQLKPGLDGEADIRLEGLFTPAYVPRWWPQPRVSYGFRKATPRVRLHHQRRVDGANGKLTVYLAQSDGFEERPVAVIEGSIGYPLYDMQLVDAELYRFGGQTWVLRVWFFWLDLDISPQDLGRHWLQQPAEVEAAWKGITVQEDGGTAVKSWAELHEIPDAERVDLLFDDDLELLCAATDLHWRELWGMFTPTSADELLQAEIMNTRTAALTKNRKALWQVVKGWGTVILSSWANNEPPYMPHKTIESELKKEGKLAADAVQMESHTPAFHNWTVALRYTSTDVTDG